MMQEQIDATANSQRRVRSRRPEIVTAVVHPGQGAPAGFPYEAVHVTDPAVLNRLAGFFDDYWSGPPSRTGVGALPEFTIELVERGGERHRLGLTSELRWCMTPRGDRPLHPAFAAFFQMLAE